MSKSKGNVIDPLSVIAGMQLEDLVSQIEESVLPPKEKLLAIKERNKEFPKGIEECGADALRTSLLSYMTNENCRGINLNINKVVSFKHFMNKIWNLYKFGISNIEKLDTEILPFGQIKIELLSSREKWILRKLNALISRVRVSVESYRFIYYVQGVYDFTKKDLCDVYLELIKAPLDKNDGENQKILSVLFFVLDSLAKVMHPLLPHVTEEIWQALHSNREESKFLILEEFPSEFLEVDEFEEDEKVIERVTELVGAFRSFTSITGFDYKAQKSMKVYLSFSGDFGDERDEIKLMCSNLSTSTPAWRICGVDGEYVKIFEKDGICISVELDVEMIDEKDIKILELKKNKLLKYINSLEKKKKTFANKNIPSEIRDKENIKLKESNEQHSVLDQLINGLSIK